MSGFAVASAAAYETTMLDIVGALFAGAYCAALVWTLIWGPSRSMRIRIALTGAFVVWLVAITAFASAGAFAPGVLGPIPTGLAAFAVALVPLLAAWGSRRRIRDALLAVDLPVLVGLHAFRLGGIFFVLLGLSGRLALIFALTAGIGDIVTGGVALALTIRRALGHRVSARALHAWNAFGMLDLVLALVTAVLANSASPMGFLGTEPGTREMTTMPWILVPAVIVPVLFLTHILIGARTRSMASDDRFPVPSNA
jgi:hypothetical protein